MKVFFSHFILSVLLMCGVTKAQKQNSPLEFNGVIGSVIDAQENFRYNVFGDIPGFTAARIVALSPVQADFLLIRNFENRAQALRIDIPASSFSQLHANLINRMRKEEKSEFDFALLPVEDSIWEEESTHKKVVLRDGSQLLGTLKKAQGDTLVIQTHGGLEIPVPSVSIVTISSSGGEAVYGRFFRADPNTSRLFFAPTGRRLQAGSGYFADYWIFFPTAAFGITNNFSFAGGMSLIPGADTQLFYFMPKLTFEVSETAGIGTGLMHMRIPEETGGFTLAYAVSTFGKPTGGVTIGAGTALGKNAGDVFILLVGGETQVSNSAKLITENWIFIGDNETFTALSGGVRFFGDRLAVDLALITMIEAWGDNGFPFMPWVDFSVFWGK
jgi:hypothetical protein